MVFLMRSRSKQDERQHAPGLGPAAVRGRQLDMLIGAYDSFLLATAST